MARNAAMRLGVVGWAALAAAAIALLAAAAVRRPIMDALYGRSRASSGYAGFGLDDAAKVRFEIVLSGFSEPVDLQFVPGGAGQAVLLEKGGRARWVELPDARPPDAGPPQPVVEGSSTDLVVLPVHKHSELGLLGLAFHPRYTENGRFYLNHNPRDGGPLRTRISEWHLPRADLGRRAAEQTRVLLEIDQPYANHDGGQVAFGADGFLYIGMGDGGHRADPQNHGQNLGSLLGKILRIDVDAAPAYGVPGDNPFVNAPGARPEIWAYGLRNPWRFSFDAKGRVIAADVGQDAFEEVDVVSAGDNLGWKVREGTHCFSPRKDCPTAGFVDPVFEYEHALGSSVTGGHVYLGKALPWLEGKYVVADFVSGRVWALELTEARGPARAQELGRFPHAISAFARDANGELYALDFNRGLILRLAPA